jgi:hypothetical protein
MWKTISDENPVTTDRPLPALPGNQVSYRFLCHRERPCKSRSSTHLPNFENGLRKITIVPPRYGWVFTTSALTREVLPTVRHWTKLYVLDGLTEYARASTKPPINSGRRRRLVQIRFSVGQLGQHMKPSLTLRGWGRDCRTKGTASAAEVRFSKPTGRSHVSSRLSSFELWQCFAGTSVRPAA